MLRLQNLGSTCALNACAQFCAGIPEFKKVFAQDISAGSSNNFKQLHETINADTTSIFTPAGLVASISDLFPAGIQHVAAEF